MTEVSGSRLERLDEFAWRSVEHLEARITTTDAKANVLLGLVTAATAITGALGQSVVRDGNWSGGWADAAATGLALDAVLLGAIVLLCLRTVNPARRSHASRSDDGIDEPLEYVLWPKKRREKETAVGRLRAVARLLAGRSLHTLHVPKEHANALHALDEKAALDNLVYMQAMLVQLVERKLEAYRLAVWLTRVLVVFQAVVVPLSFIAIGTG